MQKEMKGLQQNLAKGRLEIKSIETQIKELQTLRAGKGGKGDKENGEVQGKGVSI